MRSEQLGDVRGRGEGGLDSGVATDVKEADRLQNRVEIVINYWEGTGVGEGSSRKTLGFLLMDGGSTHWHMGNPKGASGWGWGVLVHRKHVPSRQLDFASGAQKRDVGKGGDVEGASIKRAVK